MSAPGTRRDLRRWLRHHRSHGPTFATVAVGVYTALFLAGYLTGVAGLPT